MLVSPTRSSFMQIFTPLVVDNVDVKLSSCSPLLERC